ncbi:MAG TPA: hypothetical protein EYQ50_07950 [Verrucomicrobiales bacterium]|nr:hypothetical protein [Verrucomicrobiales bacterium]HIL71733.1 hypothetical protein [Verrucomicrobiota bacterium]
MKTQYNPGQFLISIVVVVFMFVGVLLSISEYLTEVRAEDLCRLYLVAEAKGFTLSKEDIQSGRVNKFKKLDFWSVEPTHVTIGLQSHSAEGGHDIETYHLIRESATGQEWLFYKFSYPGVGNIVKERNHQKVQFHLENGGLKVQTRNINIIRERRKKELNAIQKRSDWTKDTVQSE